MWWVRKDRRQQGHRKAGSEKRKKGVSREKEQHGPRHGVSDVIKKFTSSFLDLSCSLICSPPTAVSRPAGLLHSSWGWKEQSQFLGNGNHTPHERGEWLMECTCVDVNLLSELIPSTECDSQCVVTGHVTLKTSLNSAESASTLNWDSIAAPLFGN